MLGVPILKVSAVRQWFKQQLICLGFAVQSQGGAGGRKAGACANSGEEILGSGAFKW